MITKPTLLIDGKKCRSNIRMMSDKAKKHSLTFRPHFKTHQLHEVGRWFREEGVSKITVSSLDMAQYFAGDGWDDITVAFPVNVLEIDTINELAKKITLNLLVESDEAVTILAKGLNQSVNLFIKIDVGTHRTGILSTEQTKIRKIVEAIESSDKMNWKGFLAHAGHSYHASGKKAILKIHEDCMSQLAKLRNSFNDYPDLIISYGDTPTCSIADSFPVINELRPGNFAFYDFVQLNIGACSQEQIAVAMACPVVAKHPEREEIIIYGGGVHFSKDKMHHFGQVVADVELGWGGFQEGVILSKLSQEHGTISAPKDWIDKTAIGDILKILPIHSCLTMDLMRHSSWIVIS
ncbi:MAG: alanine racemase [Cytophagales bacterium]|nr:alanine racemase [Cytophagales bacterium]